MLIAKYAAVVKTRSETTVQSDTSDARLDTDELGSGANLHSSLARRKSSAGSLRRTRRSVDFQESLDIANEHQPVLAPQQPCAQLASPGSSISPSTTNSLPSAISGSAKAAASSMAAMNFSCAEIDVLNTQNSLQNTQQQQAKREAHLKAAQTLSDNSTVDTPRGTPAVSAAAPATNSSGGAASKIQTLGSSTGGLDGESEVHPPWRIGASLKSLRIAALVVLVVFMFFVGMSYTSHQIDPSPVDLGMEGSFRKSLSPDQDTNTAPKP
jgi:hypothetical protein